MLKCGVKKLIWESYIMILSVHNINKSFDGKDILRNASFHIEKDEKAAIVGINGAGKTTLRVEFYSLRF